MSDETWMRIVDVQLLLILLYGCHLWDMESSTTVRSVNTAFRKGVRRGLGMNSRDSLHDRLEGFQEASDKIRRFQLLFLKRSVHAKNELVQTLALRCYEDRSRSIVRGRYTNLFAVSYKELKSCKFV